jgi:acetylornithine/succinyldiaminopimelate/putrescine aminotransferase
MNSTTHLFRAATTETLGLLEQLNQQKKPIFVVPTKFISAEAAQVGYLLNSLYEANREIKPNSYKSFFCNSQYEALQGAIKIARHRQWNRYKHHGGRILISDPTRAIKDYFLFQPEETTNLILPGVEIFETNEALEPQLTHKRAAAACFLRLDDRFEQNTFNRIQQQCSQKHILFGVDFSSLALAEIGRFFQQFDCQADLYVWGEQLTNQQIPFGVFSMSDDVYKPWNTVQNCLLHSSTYSGNLLALNQVKQVLLDNFQWSAEILKNYSEIETSDDSKKKFFSAHVNPNLEKLYQLAGYNLEVKEASGCYLTVKPTDEKEPQVLLDCLSGGALGIFGHNPPDLSAAVLSIHDSSHDYWQDFTKELCQLTGFDFAFPAVSGATAVENGMFAALLAQAQHKRKILVFDNNYSGKLLLPLIASPSKVQPSHQFGPLYEQVVVIDAFAPNATEQLLAEIRSGEVGLIWFEYLRGSDGQPLPDSLIEIINQYQEEYKYYIGVDEILMGLYRTGPLFSYQRTALRPDIVTLAKGLSYMSFPIGVTLVRSSVYQKAVSQAPDLVKGMETRYVNQLGSQIALHCLNRLQTDNIAGNVEKQSRYLYEQLEKLANETNLIERIEMAGLYFCVHLKMPWWIKMWGELGRTLYLLFLTKCWKRAGVFAFFDTRLMPSLCLSETEVTKLLESTQKVLKMRPLKVFGIGLSRKL